MKREFLYSAISVALGLLVGAAFLMLTGKDPISTYRWMFYGAWGKPSFIAETMTRTTPLVFTGLALMMGFRAGVFNIGAEGQLLMGGLTAAVIGIYLHLPFPIHPLLALTIAALVGGVLGYIPGVLKVKRGLNEVVVTILMNYVAIYFTNYLVRGPLKSGYLPRTAPVAESARIPIIFPGTRLHAGFILAVVLAVFLKIILDKSTWGYELKATGYNPLASLFGGIKTSKMVVLAMTFSGALAAMAGAVEILGLHHRFYGQFSPGYGFDGIMVSLIGRNDPIGVVFAAMLLATLRAGAGLVQLRAGVSKEIIWVIQALIILFVSISQVYDIWFRKRGELT